MLNCVVKILFSMNKLKFVKGDVLINLWIDMGLVDLVMGVGCIDNKIGVNDKDIKIDGMINRMYFEILFSSRIYCVNIILVIWIIIYSDSVLL